MTLPTRRHLITGLGLAALAGPAFARDAPWPGFALAQRRVLPSPQGTRIAQWTLVRAAEGREPVTLVWAQARGPSAAMRIVPVDRRGLASPLYRGVALPGAVAAINGSFFEGSPGQPDERTMGLIRLNGVTRRAPSGRRSGGFLAISPGGPRIVSRARTPEALAAPNAIESSPILILNGQSGMRADDRVPADRVAAGVTRSGAVVLVGAFALGQDTVSLFQFEQLARRAAIAEGEVLSGLIAMDGGPSAHLYLPASGRLYGSPSSIFLTNLVAIGA